MRILTIWRAYVGCEHKTKKDTKKDWDDGEDFISHHRIGYIYNGKIDKLKKMGYTHIRLMYDEFQKSFIIRI